MAIQSVKNGLYVSAEVLYTGNFTGELRARASKIGSYESFEECQDLQGAYTFKSLANGLYVSAEYGYTGNYYGMLRARASQIGPWEIFYKYFQGNNAQFTIWSDASGSTLYTSTEMLYTGNDQYMLRSRASSPGSWEYYTWTPLYPV